MTDILRQQLAASLDWSESHASFAKAVDGLDPALRGVRPTNLPHSVWELVEHIRIAQHDIWDFCINPQYKHELSWPADYWPPTPAPPTATAWDASLDAIRRDVDALRAFVLDPSNDLAARVPHGDGQSYIREVLLVVDHTAYHTGEIVFVRRLLGAWNPSA
jgi:hypothetical protein